MAHQLQHLVGREHLGLHVEFFLEFMVINARIAGGEDQHAAVRRFERQRFCDPRTLNTKSLCRQINGRTRDRELLHTVLHTKLPEIRSSCFDRHLLRSYSLKYLKHMIAQAAAFVKPRFFADGTCRITVTGV